MNRIRIGPRTLVVAALAVSLASCGVVDRMEERSGRNTSRRASSTKNRQGRTAPALARIKSALAPVKHSASRWSLTNGPSIISQAMLRI